MPSTLKLSSNDINVLLMGETGVGKSTFINALINYLSYGTLDDALKGELFSLIPASFVVTDNRTYEQKKVSIGDGSNENQQQGQSSTQACRSYVFTLGETNLRIIDTPGIGDTRGIAQDQKNFQNIMAFISNFDHLNGICLLLKPNETRLNVFLRFCIKELLTHLHRSATDNIVFCFTNARSTFYTPGETAPLLKELLKEIKQQTGVDVPFARENTFCFDNESFRFLAASKQVTQFNLGAKEDFAKSWDTSVKQSSDLISRIKQCAPHRVKDTVSLNEVRRLINELTRPIAEIARNIESNIAVAQDRMDECKYADMSIDELRMKLKIPTVDLESVQLAYPRTVCTSTKCTAYVQFQGKVKVDYKTHCHEHCYLQGVAQNVVNNVALTRCSAMAGGNTCTHCGCSWENHMHINYDTKQVNREIINSSVESQIKTKEGMVKALHEHRKILQQRIDDLKGEQATLTSTCVKLSQFLHKNSITPYNDDLIAYVEHLLKQEKEKQGVGANNQGTIDALQQMIASYQKEMNSYKEMLKQSGTIRAGSVLSIDEIYKLISGLYNLKLSGENLNKQIQVIRVGTREVGYRIETRCRPAENKAFLHEPVPLMTSWWDKCKGLVSKWTPRWP